MFLLSNFLKDPAKTADVAIKRAGICDLAQRDIICKL